MTVLAFSSEEAVWSGTEMRAVDPSSLGAVLRVAEAPPVDSFSSAFADDARQLARTHSGSAAATARLAQAELNADQPEAALAAARQAIDLAKSAGDESALSVAAQVLAVLGEWKSAKQALGEIGNAPYWRLLDAAWLIQEGDATRALERLKGLDTIDGLALRGWLSIKQSDYSRAIRDFRLALRKGSRNPSLLTNLGYAHAATGAMEKAIGETREALRLAPSSKTAGLNLVFYLSACGDFDGALDEARRLRGEHSKDMTMSLAVAGVQLRAAEVESALRTLQKARSELLFGLTRVERAELDSSIALLEWRVGSKELAEAAKTVLRELARSDYQSLKILSAVTAVLVRCSDAPRVEKIFAEAVARHNPSELLGFEAHLRVLQGRFEEAAQLSQQWAARDLFGAGPAIAATYLTADYLGDYSRAVEIGMSALRRIPASSEIANNVAYAMALSGRTAEARRLLERFGLSSPFVVATNALIDLATGRRGPALEGYRRAQMSALAKGNEILATLVDLNCYFASCVLGAGVQSGGDCDSAPMIHLPKNWHDNPRFVLLDQASRRRGLPPLASWRSLLAQDP